MKNKSLLSLVALTAFGLASNVHAARNHVDDCDPCAPSEPCAPAPCYSQESCYVQYCYGPENVNPAVRPMTCDGDWTVTVAGFYWTSHMDGLEYAVRTNVATPEDPSSALETGTLNNIVDGKFLKPDNKWNWGAKVGVGYNSCCDGWDFGVLWTTYKAKARSHEEAEPCDNASLVTLWSAYSPPVGGVLYACDITTEWKAKINLIDITLGREFWTSKYLALHPFIGVRIGFIKQSYDLDHKGGSWSANTNVTNSVPFNNSVEQSNNFKGAGVIAGLDSLWGLGCGFSIYGDFAASLLYGRFDLEHDEENRQASDLHAKTPIYENSYSFRAAKPILDLGIGLEWASLLCECKYHLAVRLGWEQHLFFGQNQFWRANRVADTELNPLAQGVNNSGENVFLQRRGDLDTEGWTLRFDFAF